MEDLSSILNLKKQRRAFNKNIAGPANNAEVDILNVASGGGIVNYLWVADTAGVGGGYPEYDHHIRVYTDGSSTPDIDIDLGLFFGYAYGDAFPHTDISTRYWHGRNAGTDNNHRTAGAIRLPIPFSNGIRIAIANINDTPVSALFSQVEYALAADNVGMTIPPYKLYVAGNSWISNRQTALMASDVTLATIGAGNAGVIVGHSMAFGGANDYTYLERELALTIDAEGSPSIQSSGTEDWFTGSYYFYSGQSPYRTYSAMGLGAAIEANVNPCPASALVDFLALVGGIAFTSSATLQWLHHCATDTDATYGSALFYYRHT